MNIEHVTSPASVATEKGAIPPAFTVGAEPATKSTGDLLKDLSSQVTDLVHEEVALAKIEMSEKAKKFGVGTGMLGGASLCAVFARDACRCRHRRHRRGSPDLGGCACRRWRSRCSRRRIGSRRQVGAQTGQPARSRTSDR